MNGSVRCEQAGAPDPACAGARDAADYAAGVSAGSACRRGGGAITRLRMIAINDHYSAGYRAGYFERAG